MQTLPKNLYDVRKNAGLTQKELAKIIGTKQSVVSRIESSDYEGQSLKVLWRVARALKMKLRVEFYACTAKEEPQTLSKEVNDFVLNWGITKPEWQVKQVA